MMNKKKRQRIYFVAMICFVWIITIVAAAPLREVEEREQSGSIQVHLTEEQENKSRNGIPFYCTKVAEIESGKYKLIGDYQDTKIDLNEMKSSVELKQAGERLLKVKKHAEQAAVTNQNGQVTFDNLKEGVYLIWSEEKGGYDQIEPVLAAVPTWDEVEETMLYDIKVEPKHSPVQKMHPKTGDSDDMGWNVLFGIGSACTLIGICCLRKEGKK